MLRPLLAFLLLATGCSAAAPPTSEAPASPATARAAAPLPASPPVAPIDPACEDAARCAGADCSPAPKAIAVGDGHACALGVAGELFCWGDDRAGQLGDGGREPRATPRKIATGIEGVAAGEGFTCVIERGGNVRCWGVLPPVVVGPTREETARACKADPAAAVCRIVEATRAMEERMKKTLPPAAAKRFDAQLEAEHRKADAEATTSPSLSPPLSGAVSIAAGGDTGCAIDRAGRAICFKYAGQGSSTSLILGRDRMAKPSPIAGTHDLVEIAPGAIKSCGRTKSGKALCWDWSTAATEVPGLDDVTSIAMSQERACAVARGGVQCWATRSGTPAPLDGLGKAIDVRGGGLETMCARTSSGEVACWGGLGERTPGAEVGPEIPVKIPGARGASSIAVGSGHACATTADGVRCWGATKHGALGTGLSAEVTSPVEVKLEAAAVDVAAGDDTSCAALADGRVRCWGRSYGNEPGAFAGDGPASRVVPGVTGASRVFIGEQVACAISRGAVSCWAHGDPASPARAIPGIADALAVAPGIAQTCVARASGETACFYGAGPPAPLPGVRDLVELSYGASDWSCGRKRSGEMLCWQMPFQVPGGSFAPPKLTSIASAGMAVSVATSAFRSCAALRDGSLVCAGSMARPPTARQVPGFENAVQVGVHNTGSVGSLLCTRTRNGEVQCSGDGGSGELGAGSFAAPAYPGVSTVKGIADATSIAVGARHACALRAGGRVSCWGSDVLGQVTGSANGIRRCARPIKIR